MFKLTKAGILVFMIPAFLLYFVSEIILRQAIVASVGSANVKVEQIISELPAAVRETVNYQIHIGQLRDDLKKAETPADRAQALSNLADYTKDIKERDKLFLEVIKSYPDLTVSSRAWNYFFLNEDASRQVTIPEFHSYIVKNPPMDQCYLWTLGFAKLNTLKADNKTKMDYLLPLLDITPVYRNYARLYESLEQLAAHAGNTDIYNKAAKLETKSLDMPFIEEIIEKRIKDATTPPKGK